MDAVGCITGSGQRHMRYLHSLISFFYRQIEAVIEPQDIGFWVYQKSDFELA